MVMALLRFFRDITVSYWGDCWFGIIFALALVAIFFVEKDKLKKIPFFWFAAAALILIYNPVTYLACKRFFASNFMGYYLKLYNLVPVIFILVYGLTLLASKTKGWVRFGVVGVFCGIMIISGTTVQRQPWFSMSENTEKIPADVMAFQEIFSEQIQNNERIHIMAPTEVAVYLRQYEDLYCQIYGREEVDHIELELISEEPDVDAVYEYAIGNDIDYVVVKNQSKAVQTFDDKARFEEAGHTDNYFVYQVKMPKWVLSQYKDNSGNQGVCYMFRNTENDKMVVIDGGSMANGQGLYEDIKFWGGEVEAWIVTHYHSDHVGAFNYIFDRYDDLDVKAIYDSPLDYEYFTGRAFEWDEVDYFDKYLELTENMDNVNHVTRGQEITIDGDLKIKFFNTYDELCKETGSDDIANNCALVLKASTNESSVLFMSDCHSEAMGLMLMEQFKDELKADYLECAHHGNNSIPETTGFYELVDPKTALFDAPEWLMTGENYSAKTLAEYLEKRNVTIKWFDRIKHSYAF